MVDRAEVLSSDHKKSPTLVQKAKRIAARGLIGITLTAGLGVAATDAFLAPVNISVEGSVQMLVHDNFDPKLTYLDIISNSTMHPLRKALLNQYFDVLDDVADLEGKESVLDKLKKGIIPNFTDIVSIVNSSNEKFSDVYKKARPILTVFDFINTDSFKQDVLVVAQKDRLPVTSQFDVDGINNTYYSQTDKEYFKQQIKTIDPTVQAEALDFILTMGNITFFHYDATSKQSSYYSAKEIDSVFKVAQKLAPKLQKMLYHTLTVGSVFPDQEEFKLIFPLISEYTGYIFDTDEAIQPNGLTTALKDEFIGAIKNRLIELRTYPQYSYEGNLSLNTVRPFFDYCTSITGDRLTGTNLALKIMSDLKDPKDQAMLISNIGQNTQLEKFLQNQGYQKLIEKKLTHDDVVILLRADASFKDNSLKHDLPRVRIIEETHTADLFYSLAIKNAFAHPDDFFSYLAIYQRILSILGERYVPVGYSPEAFFELATHAIRSSKVDILDENDFAYIDYDTHRAPNGTILVLSGSNPSLTSFSEADQSTRGITIPLIFNGEADDFIAIDQNTVFMTDRMKEGQILEILARLQNYDFMWKTKEGLFFGKPNFLRDIHVESVSELVDLIKSNSTFFSRVLPVSEETVEGKNHLRFLEGDRWVGQVIITDKEKYGTQHEIYEMYTIVLKEGEELNLAKYRELSQTLEVENDEGMFILVPDAGFSAKVITSDNGILKLNGGGNAQIGIHFNKH